MSFGKRMQAQRKKLDISQRELAQALEVPEATISRLENDRHLPNLALALKIARELKVGLDYLAGTFEGEEGEVLSGMVAQV